MKTCFNNQSSPSTFISLGSEQTAVDLAYFRARSVNSSVYLEWRTESEFDNEGFNILRDEGNGTPIQINPYLIPSKGLGGFGAEYWYTDSSVLNGITYYYMLEAVDVFGQSSFFGPVKVAPHDITLIWPVESEPVTIHSCLFSWRSGVYSSFKAEISFGEQFTAFETLSFPRERWTSNQFLWFPPATLERLFTLAQSKGGPLFWRVIAKTNTGDTVVSESREIIYQNSGLPGIVERWKKRIEKRKKSPFSPSDLQ